MTLECFFGFESDVVENLFIVLKEHFLDRFASPLAVRPKEASDCFHTIRDVMPLTASAHVVACAATSIAPLHSLRHPSRKSFAFNEAKQVRGPLQLSARRSGDRSPDLCHAVSRISTSFGSVCFAPSCSAKGSFR